MEEVELTRTDEILNPEQQKAVLLLAARMQQKYDEGATLADLIAIGQEAGLSREAVEEAYHTVMSEPSESNLRERMGRRLGNEITSIFVTIAWSAAIWLGVLFLPYMEILGMLGVFATLIVFPVLMGSLNRKPFSAAALAMWVVMNLAVSISIRFGIPQETGGQENFLALMLPVVLAFLVSLVTWHVVPRFASRGKRKLGA
jgi:uncharacterized protein with PQ loop repeat